MAGENFDLFMNILFFGDIAGRAGRAALKKALPRLKRKYKPDFIIANGENIAHGLGVTKKTVSELLNLGIDLLTSGNHVFDKEEAKILLGDGETPLLRPLNYKGSRPGRGFSILTRGLRRLLVINLEGQIFMPEEFDHPFFSAEKILEKYGLGRAAALAGQERVDAILVDFHAEATSEKKMMGWLLDGRVSAVLGTHTHVQTNDERILPKKTAYISDVGMVGVEDSSLGVDFQTAVNCFLTNQPIKVRPAFGGPVEINAVLVKVEKNSGLAKSIVKIREKVLKYR